MNQKTLWDQDKQQIFHAAAVWRGHIPVISSNESEK